MPWGRGGNSPSFFMEQQIVITAADLAMLAYSLVFMGGVIGGWAFILGTQQRF